MKVKKPSQNPPVAIDLFCGAGGMSLGFEQAGFQIRAAFDLEDFNIATHLTNFPATKAIKADARNLTGDFIRSESGLVHRDIDVVFGGPPCQGFSFGGKHQPADTRNLLVYEFSRIIRQLQPKYFVMENVKGLLSKRSRPILQSFVRRIKLAGYSIVEPLIVLNAAEYGVPQRRERVFILGCRKGLDLPKYPEPRGCFDDKGKEFKPLVRDAISDLQFVSKSDDVFTSDVFNGGLRPTKNAYAQLMRGDKKSPDDFSRRDYTLRSGLLTGCLHTVHSMEVVKRFQQTQQGTSEPISRYYRLDWSRVSPTIRAGTGADHGSHTAPRPIHPSSPRCITAREAARLHSFPDSFVFHATRWHAFRQIGNSVPPKLAAAVAKQIMMMVS